MRSARHILILMVLVFMVAGCGGGATSNDTSNKSQSVGDRSDTQATIRVPESTQPDVATDSISSLDEVRNGTVQIEAQGAFVDFTGEETSSVGRGSGFIIDSSGIAVTNNHVVAGAGLLKVWRGGESRTYNAKVLGVSECSDLAVIDIEGKGFPYLQWYEGDVKPGLDVYAAGYPLGEPEFSLTRGIISKARAGGETSWASVDSVVEHDATINPGNSGGPLVTSTGQVVGVNYSERTNSNQYYAIGHSQTESVIDELLQGHNVDTIGINGEAIVTDDQTLSGIWVYSVTSGSPADRAGIKAGDFILQLAGVELAGDGTMADYCDILRTHKPEDTINIRVVRLSTNEILDGQINGRALSVTGSLAGNTGVSSEDTGESNGGTTNSVLFEDDFSDTSGGWDIDSDSDITRDIYDGSMHISVLTENTAGWSNPGENFSDFVLKVQATEEAGPDDNAYGVILRYTDGDNFYVFEIDGTGVYHFQKQIDNEWIDLIKWTKSNAIRKGKASNVIGVVCQGNEFTFFINDKEVGSYRDSSFPAGDIGLTVTKYEGDGSVDISFDNLTVSSVR